MNGGSAVAASEAFDTITLVPPSSYTNLTVTLFVNDKIDVTLNGGGSGSVAFTWTIPGVFQHTVTVTTADNSVLVAHPKVSRPDSTSPFQFLIKKKISASASSSDVKAAETLSYSTYATPEIDLPQGSSGGWSCTYASGRRCPD